MVLGWGIGGGSGSGIGATRPLVSCNPSPLLSLGLGPQIEIGWKLNCAGR